VDSFFGTKGLSEVSSKFLNHTNIASIKSSSIGFDSTILHYRMESEQCAPGESSSNILCHSNLVQNEQTYDILPGSKSYNHDFPTLSREMRNQCFSNRNHDHLCCSDKEQSPFSTKNQLSLVYDGNEKQTTSDDCNGSFHQYFVRKDHLSPVKMEKAINLLIPNDNFNEKFADHLKESETYLDARENTYFADAMSSSKFLDGDYSVKHDSYSMLDACDTTSPISISLHDIIPSAALLCSDFISDDENDTT
jgi:hypothetical protein